MISEPTNLDDWCSFRRADVFSYALTHEKPGDLHGREMGTAGGKKHWVRQPSGYLTEEGKLFVENTQDVNLVCFMLGGISPLGVAVKKPENALIVAGPKAFVAEWLCEGRDDEHAIARINLSFIFYRAR